MDIRNVISINIPRTVVLIAIIGAIIVAGIAMEMLLRQPKPSVAEEQEFVQQMDDGTEVYYRVVTVGGYINELTEIMEMISKAETLEQISLSRDQAKELLPLLERLDRASTTTPAWESWPATHDAITAVWGDKFTPLLDAHESDIELFKGDVAEDNPFAKGERKEVLQRAMKVLKEMIK